MKKIIIHYMMMALGILSFTACHEDKGNYDYRELIDFYVDQQDIPANITITQFHTLNLSSRLVYGGNKEELEYKWIIVSTSNMETVDVRDTLATTEDLSAPVSVAPGSYLLFFTATDRESKRSTLQQYNLKVEGSIGAGLLVLHEKNGVVDCDLIKSKALSTSLARDTVLRALYSQANPGYPLAGKPLQMAVLSLAPFASYVYLWTDADGVRLSSVDMSITHHFADLFFAAPETVKPQGYNLTGGGIVEILINDGKYYFLSVLNLTSGSEKDLLFASTPGDYHAAPYAVQASVSTTPMFYDQTTMRFYAYSTEVIPVTSTVPGNAFDFGNVGKKMVYMEAGFGTGRYLAVFKNPVEDEKRYLYVMNLNTAAASPFAATAAYDISAWTDIANAGRFTFGTRGPVGFYATDSHVYRYTYDPNDFSVQPIVQEAWPYIPTGETIAALQLTKYGSSQDKYLLIATYNETSREGKIYMIEVDVTNGTCATTPTSTYTGFGKVAGMTFKPQ
jgi:hypothetical protein